MSGVIFDKRVRAKVGLRKGSDTSKLVLLEMIPLTKRRKKTGDRAEGCRIKGVQILFGSDGDGQD